MFKSLVFYARKKDAVWTYRQIKVILQNDIDTKKNYYEFMNDINIIMMILHTYNMYEKVRGLYNNGK